MVATEERRSYRDFLVVVGILLAVLVITQLPRREARASGVTDGRVMAVLGSARRTVTDSTFRTGNVTTVLGGSRLDLREVALAPGEEIVLDVLSVFGSVTIRVPDGWTIDAQAIPVLGALRDLRMADPVVSGPTAPPRLVLHGAVVMGGLRITS